MSELFDELITGLNEAVAIERGELNGRITVRFMFGSGEKSRQMVVFARR